jgi:hypothetical protein
MIFSKEIFQSQIFPGMVCAGTDTTDTCQVQYSICKCVKEVKTIQNKAAYFLHCLLVLFRVTAVDQ